MDYEVLHFQRVHDVSRETIQKFEIYSAVLEKWNKNINLVSKSTLSEKWRRHFSDSAQIFDYIPEKAFSLTDLGSGGGFPGLVLAIIASEKRPNFQVRLIEADNRKCAFLSEVIRKLNLNATLENERIELAKSQKSDIVTARALAPLKKLLNYVTYHQNTSTVIFLPKGSNYKAEISEARKRWSFDLDEIASKTDPEGAILKITKLRQIAE